MNTSKVDLVQAGYLLLGIVILCIAAWWWHSTPASAPVGMATPATIAKEVKNVPTETIQPKKLVVYKQQAAANLGQSVADWVKNDMRIAAATSVKEDTHPQTIVTAVDTTTGKVETRVVREGYPWLAALQTGEVGVLYGSANGAPQTRLEAREYLLQVKAARLGVAAEIDNSGRWFAGAVAIYRW